MFRYVLDTRPKGALVVRPAVIEAVVLPPIGTLDTLEREIHGVRDRYIEVLAIGHSMG